MRIGIITFHAPHNRGSMLQAFAIQNIVKKLRVNDDVEIINFSNERQRDMYAFMRRLDSWKDFFLNCFKLLFYSKYKRYFDDFSDFRNAHFILGEKEFRSSKELAQLNGVYDCLVAGSDQIWNTKCYDADDAYFLGWSDCRHTIAYAPSFGSNDLNLLENKQLYRDWLNRFGFVSIRENNGKKWIKALTDRNVEVVLDPTLLVPRNEWDELANEMLDLPDRFIFFYSTGYPENVCRFVSQYAKMYGMPVIMTDIKHWALKGWKYGFRLAGHGGPNAFLTLIKKAALVLTSSFHGTAFSIIFEKCFYYLDDGVRRPSDDRALTLIEDMDLLFRFKNVNTDSLPPSLEQLDYDGVNRKLQVRKNFSLSWLENALNTSLSE